MRVLLSASERQPALLVFEDVDRYDRPSQELLLRLTEGRDHQRLRVLVSNGPAFAERWPPSVARVDLGPLGDDALGALADHLRKHANEALPDETELAKCTNRLPGCVAQLARFVVEGGSVDTAPRSVADLIAARLEQLPRAGLILCQAAAVLGCETSRRLLEQTASDHLDPGEIDEAVALLAARGLLAVDDPAILFNREIVRKVVYEATPANVRRDLHAAALRALRGTGADAAVLGHHHERADDLIEAADLLSRAGDDAVYQFDDVGACALYQRALVAARKSLLASADDSSRIRFVTISIKLSDALRVGGELGLARGVVDEAMGHCSGAPTLEAQLLRASGHLSLTEGDTENAIATVRRAIGHAIPAGQTDMLSELYLDLSSMYLRNGQPGSARDELEEGIDLATLGEGAAAEAGPHTLWRMLLRLAQLCDSHGEPERSRSLAVSALRHARRVHSRLGTARVQATLATLYENDGNAVKAERYRQAAVDEMRRLGDRRGTAELLLAGSGPTRRLLRITPASLREARELAAEVGWTEGVERAKPNID
ncbi:MAG: hypothetical protein JRF63_08970 [Deltaproteobacteria bacterium]|nr:hypothetical protein [Deltaproteobacteria bacterium]